MKKILTRLLVGSSLLSPLAVLAFDPSSVAQPGTTGYIPILINVINAIWIILVGLAVIMFIWSGVMYVTAAGDPERAGKAKNAAVYGVIGVVLAFLAFSVIQIVRGLLGV